MSRLAELNIVDIRDKLPRATWSIGRRGQAPTGATLHYNGPALSPAVQNDRARLIQFIRDVDVPNHMQRIGADGLCYHFVVTAAGEILQTRDLDAVLWHCANAAGNKLSVAVHLPLGGTQDASEVQWQRTTDLFDALIADHHMSGRSAVRGHREWPRLDGVTQSACPGPILTRRLKLWRSYTQPSALRRYRTRFDDCFVREGPSRSYPVAWKGRAKLPAGYAFDVDTIKPDEQGEFISGAAQWAHMADGLGFVHASLLQAM